MSLPNHAADAALAGLNECFGEVEQVAPWRWRCAMRDESRLPISAVLTDGFLRLGTEPCPTSAIPAMEQVIEQGTHLNTRLAGGAKAVLLPREQQLKFCADIVVLDEPQARARLAWAAQNLREAVDALDSHAPGIHRRQTEKVASPSEFSKLFRQSSWEFAECAAHEWSVALDAEAAPPAKVRIQETGIFASVELVRVNAAAKTSRRALAWFLLTAGWMLRFVRARVSDSETQLAFAFEVALPPAPAPEELDHALASLSVAHRGYAREAQVLLDETAACCYLALRDPSANNQPLNKKEN